MGLDQYVYADTRNHPVSAVDDQLNAYKPEEEINYNTDPATWKRDEVEEIFYFRKHHDLQGWMSELAKARGAEMQWDSMVGSIILTSSNLDDLEKDVNADELPETGGFFFGEGNTESYKDATLEMIAKAREAIAENKRVWYSCSW